MVPRRDPDCTFADALKTIIFVAMVGSFFFVAKDVRFALPTVDTMNDLPAQPNPGDTFYVEHSPDGKRHMWVCKGYKFGLPHLGRPLNLWRSNDNNSKTMIRTRSSTILTVCVPTSKSPWCGWAD